MAKNWDKSQQDLCKWEFLGREISEVLNGREWTDWKSEYDEFASLGSIQDLSFIRQQYGNLQAVRVALDSAKQRREETFIPSQDQIKQLDECKSQMLRLQMELNDLVGTEEDKRIIKRFQHSGGLAQLERNINDLQQYGDYGSLKRQLNLARDVSRIFGEDNAEYFRNLRNEYSGMRERMDQLQRHNDLLEQELACFGSEEDRREILGIRSAYNNDLYEVKSHLKLGQEISNLFEGCTIDDIRKFKYDSEARALELSKIADHSRELQEIQRECFELKSMLSDLGTEEDFSIMKKLKSRYDGG